MSAWTAGDIPDQSGRVVLVTGAPGAVEPSVAGHSRKAAATP